MAGTNEYICALCPRNCRAVRTETAGGGVCGMGTTPVAAKAMLHLWEEPCISGSNGSGAVFFSGCALGCAYCQNSVISSGRTENRTALRVGKPVSPARLRDIYFDLIGKGAHNINLVNPTHFAEGILSSLEGGLPVPVVYNTGGYDLPETLRRFEGLVQIYLPDFKYALREPAARYSRAPDYPEIAEAAILEMFRQTGPYVLDDSGLLKSGVVIRHLVLPGQLENTRRVIEWLDKTFAPGDVLFSLMSQYTPCGDLSALPELRRRLTQAEYDAAIRFLDESGIEDGFYQELSSAKEEYIPDFDLSGLGK